MRALARRALTRAARRALCHLSGDHHTLVHRAHPGHGGLYRQCTGTCQQRSTIPREHVSRGTGSYH